jgi:hypothetical protein
MTAIHSKIAALLVLAPLALLVLLDCKKPTGSVPAGATSGDAKADGGLTPENWVTHKKTNTKFLAPAGWKESLKNGWATFESQDNLAVLAYTTFEHSGESTVKLSESAQALGTGEVTWHTPKAGTAGKEAFPARMADGSCIFKGGQGRMFYATVNPGGLDQILLIYVVAASAPPERGQEARVAIDSLQHI